jgi:hypothetical protein
VPLKDLVGKAQEFAGAAADTAGKFLDEFHEALPTMRALGFTLKDFHIGMGLVPELSAKLIASVDAINVAKIDELIAQHKEQKLLAGLLKALQAAYRVREQLGEAAFKSVVMDITLGLPPHISVGFESAAASVVKMAPAASA